jgi:type III secretion system YopN/LcrE/InvE/MxiC family regulator
MIETSSLVTAPQPGGVGAEAPRPAALAAGEGDSVFSQAAAALADFQSDALAETAEDVGFALGARRASESARRASTDQRRGRVAVYKLVAELSSLEGAALDGLLAGNDDWLRGADPLAALSQDTEDRGRQALLLAAALARGGLSPQRKDRLETALSGLLAAEDPTLSLFGALHFGVCTPALRQHLHRLYLRASAEKRSLSDWLAELGEPASRRQTLSAMIQVLAFELSVTGAPIVGSHLAAVIGDLQRLLNLLGIASHCRAAAARLACPHVDGEMLLGCVLRLSEQLWADVELVAQMLPPTEPAWRYPLIHSLYRLIQVMSVRCFVDDEQQDRLLSALAELRDRFAD